MGELGFPIESSIVLHCGNQSAIQVSDNPIAHSKMKHVELYFHYLRQLVHDKVVTLVYCETDDHIVDIFMKPLSEVKFIKLRSFLRIQEATIMGGYEKVIPPPESPDCCVDGGCWNLGYCPWRF